MSRRLRIAKRAACRAILGLFRRVAPVLVVPTWFQLALRALFGRWFGIPSGSPTPPPLAVVLDAQAVCRVLADYETFPVHLYAEKMQRTFGPFLLGLDYPDEKYRRQVALLRAVIEPRDVAWIRDAARAATDAALHAQRACQLNAVRFVHDVLSRFVGDYFGIPEPSGARTLLQLNQRTASYIFNIDVLKGHLRADAEDAGATIREHLVDLFTRKLENPDPRAGSFTDRMVRRCGHVPGPWTPADLATVAGGTISGLLVPTSAQFIAVVDQLLDLPAIELGRLRAVARIQRTGTEVDDGRLAGYVLEAARFNPFPAALQRKCHSCDEAKRTLVTGSGRRKRIPDGATVVAVMKAAACDPLFVAQPGSFAIARPSSESLLFGTGQHHCIGATRSWPVAQTLMTEMAAALFSLPCVRRAPGRSGLLHTAKGASWPDSLYLTWSGERSS